MHKGHLALIEDTVTRAKQKNAIAAVYTFSNHPLEAFGKTVKLLMTAQQKEQTLLHAGIDQVVLEKFTQQTAALPPRAFVERLLARWDVAAVVVGFNYSFGAHAAGTPELLGEFGEEYGFEVLVHTPVELDGGTVSSTRIRRLIENGAVDEAQRLLTRPYQLSGTVVRNLGNGVKLGFPTANIEPDALLVLPQNGVYVTDAKTEHGVYRAITNVGRNLTFGAEKVTVETHLLGFSGELYGKALTISFLRRLREDRKFATMEALRDQIALDAETALHVK